MESVAVIAVLLENNHGDLAQSSLIDYDSMRHVVKTGLEHCDKTLASLKFCHGGVVMPITLVNVDQGRSSFLNTSRVNNSARIFINHAIEGTTHHSTCLLDKDILL